MKFYITELPRKLLRVSSGKFISEIDGLRFLAIFPVVLQHFTERLLNKGYVQSTALESAMEYVTRGGIGVYLFFIISGFILSLPFGVERLKNGRAVLLGRYYRRRFTRLEPPYVLLMIIFFFVLIVKQGYVGEQLNHLFASLTYTHGLIFGTSSTINPVAWSLEVEVQFYLIAPFLAKFFFSFTSVAFRRSLLVIIIAVAIALQGSFGGMAVPARLTLLGNLHYFLAGFLLTDLYLNKELIPKTKSFIWDIVAVVASFLMYEFSWHANPQDYVIFLVASFSLFIAGFRGVMINYFITRPWIMAIGGMCYTIYLIHLPFAEGLSTLWMSLMGNEVTVMVWIFSMSLFITTLFIITIITYVVLERPFMKGDIILKWYHRFKTA